MARLWYIFVFLWASHAKGAEPMRYVSLDICSDYYLSLFAPKAQDIWLTSQAKQDLPVTLPKNAQFHQSKKESIYQLKPDKVFYTDLSFYDLSSSLSSLGVNMQKWDWPKHKGELKSFYQYLGIFFENPQKAQSLITFLDKPAYKALDKNVALMGSNGFIVGKDTHYDLFFNHLGLDNYYQKSGYGQVSLEDLAQNPPHIIVRFGLNPKGYSLGQSFFDHKLFKTLNIPMIDISSFFLTCPSTEMIKAAEKVREQIQ